MAFTWEENIYMECCLPFCLSTAPFRFNLFAEVLRRLLEVYLPSGPIAHYLDDFISTSPHPP
jgi:hypothetical protein